MTDLTPDLGLHYLEAGHARSLFQFRRVLFDQIALVGPDLYSICATLHMERSYTASFDLHRAALAELFTCLPPRLAATLGTQFARPTRGPITIDMPRIAIDLSARLGTPQQGAGETFVPFLVTSVSPPSELAAVHVTEAVPRM